MKIDILISTMNIFEKSEYLNLLEKMNIKNNSIVINQCPESNRLLICIEYGNNKLFSYNEKGLSKSRNKALGKSDADICVIADDDIKYDDKYKEIIEKAYKKYPKADLIAFYVNSENPNNIKPK